MNEEDSLKLVSAKKVDNTLTVVHAEDVAPVYNRNAEIAANRGDRLIVKGEFCTPVATIPTVVWLEICRLGIDQDPVALLRFLEVYGKEKYGRAVLKTTDKKLA